MKNIKRSLERLYWSVNGTKGIISLFLVIIMCPFLSIAAALVELNKLNSAVSLLDEAMGMSSMSTLAYSDEYLHERFGLFSVSQGIDIDKVYESYISTNSEILGGGLKLNDTFAEGLYPLSDTKTLERQILEYSKFNAPTALANEFIDLSEILDKFEKLKTPDKLFDTISAGVKTLENLKKLFESVGEVQDIAEEIDKLKPDYENNFNTLNGKVSELANAQKELLEKQSKRAELQNEKAGLVSQKSSLQGEKSSLQSERSDLQSQLSAERSKPAEDQSQSTISSLQSSISSLSGQISELTTQINGLTSQISDLENKITDLTNRINELNEQIALLRPAVDIAKGNYVTVLDKTIEWMEEFQKEMAKANAAAKEIMENSIDAVNSFADHKLGLDQLKDERSQLKEEMDEMEESGADLPENERHREYEEKEKKVNELNEKISEKGFAEGMIDADAEGTKAIIEDYNKTFENFGDGLIELSINKLKGVRTKLEGLSGDEVIANYTNYISGLPTPDYYIVLVGMYITGPDVAKYLAEEAEKMASSPISAMVKGITSFIDSIFKLKTICDPKLRSEINTDYYENLGADCLEGYLAYNPVYEGLIDFFEFLGLSTDTLEEHNKNSPVVNVINDLGNVLDSSAKLVIAFNSINPVKKIIDMVNSLLKLLKSILLLIVDLICYIVDVFYNVAEFFQTGLDRLYYTSYATFNFPCRTDYLKDASFTNMTGYSFSEETLPKHGDGSWDFDNLNAMFEQLSDKTNKSGNDYVFSGAELEYILCGQNSEIKNQMYAFFSTYLIRLFFNLSSVISNPEMQTLATATTVAYPVVMGLFILAEPLADTIILVNGGDVKLMKGHKLYLTPSGLPSLISEIVALGELNNEEEKKVKKGMIDAFGKTEPEYEAKYEELKNKQKLKDLSNNKKRKEKFDLNYRKYLFFQILFTTRREVELSRIKNLIQMEGTYHYKEVEKDKLKDSFELKRNFVFINTEVKANVKPILPSIVSNSLLNIKRQQYRGY